MVFVGRITRQKGVGHLVAAAHRISPDAQVVHADIDPAEISKNRRADVPIVGDCKEIISELVEAVRAEKENTSRTVDLAPWWDQLNALRETFPLGYDWPEDGTLSPQYAIERIGAAMSLGFSAAIAT